MKSHRNALLFLNSANKGTFVAIMQIVHSLCVNQFERCIDLFPWTFKKFIYSVALSFIFLPFSYIYWQCWTEKNKVKSSVIGWKGSYSYANDKPIKMLH